jgi:hypothetical protein
MDVIIARAAGKRGIANRCFWETELRSSVGVLAYMNEWTFVIAGKERNI